MVITQFKTKIKIKKINKIIKNKKLIFFFHKSTGRNNSGKIMNRHKGGEHKKLYRYIDFKRNKEIFGIIEKILYDPNRNTKIALINYIDKEKRYILLPKNLFIKNIIPNNFKINIGNQLQLKNIPIGMYIHNIELKSLKGGKLVRSGGTSAKILAKNKKYIILRLPSKEIRLISNKCHATIGILTQSNNKKLYKAGQNRWKGIRPTVRGVAMNACDHPHGGGEGRSPIGRKHPLTLWGKIALGKKTRKNKNTKQYIIKRKK